MKSKFTIKDIAIISIFSAMLFAQEQILSFLPNIQFTIFLIVLFSKKLGFLRTCIIVIIHTTLDNIFMGSMNLLYFPFMLIGWLIIPICLNTIFKKVENHLFLALLGISFSFIYSWVFIIPSCIIQEISFTQYLLADIIYEIILAASSFLSILWLYKPTSKIVDRFI